MQDPRLNSNTIISEFTRAAASYDKASVVHQEVGKRLQERLDLLTRQPTSILDLGCNTGRDTRLLAKKYRQARVVAMDIAHAMIKLAIRKNRFRFRSAPTRYCVGRAEQLAFVDNAFDFIYSNLVLQWCSNLPLVFSECARVLQDEGLLFFASVGPDTFKELRQNVRAVDPHAQFPEFVDMHDVGDALIQAGFTDPVLESEYIVLQYQSLATLWRELQEVGATSLALGERGQASDFAGNRLPDPSFYPREGQVFPLTYEIVFGHAWCRKKVATANEIVIPISRIRRRRK
jgi:malonyl-CoA O-methyltransferase